MNHRCWRDYRKLVTYLPEILLGGTFQGIWLQCSDFDEPRASRPVAAPSTTTKREGIVERRRTRFAVTLAALERLLKWTRLERAAFMERFLGVAPRTQPGLRPVAASRHAKKEQVLVDEDIEKDLTSDDDVPQPKVSTPHSVIILSPLGHWGSPRQPQSNPPGGIQGTTTPTPPVIPPPRRRRAPRQAKCG